MYEILGMSSGIDDRPPSALINNQVTTYFVCSVRHYPHTISVNDHRDLMFKLLAFLIWVRWFDSRLFQYLIQTFVFNKCTIFTYTSTYEGFSKSNKTRDTAPFIKSVDKR